MKTAPREKSVLGPLVLLGVAAGFLGAVSRAMSGPAPAGSEPGPAGSSAAYEVPCPAGQLPDEGICVPAPSPAELLRPESTSAPQEMLGLRADRPAEYARYALPVAVASDGSAPGTLAVRAEPGSDIGPAVRISAPGGAEVRSLRLEAQVGDTEVVFATHGPPAVLITAHHLKRERGEFVQLLVHSDLAEVESALLEAMPSAPLSVEAGQRLGRGGPVGFLLGLRQLRRDVKLTDAVPDLAPDLVFASDVRNALPLAP